MSVRRKRALVILLVVTLIIGLRSGYVLSHQVAATPATIDSGTTAPTTKPTLSKSTPTFDTLTPSGKSAGSLGGWYRVSPPGSDPVYAIVDHIGTVQVIVSEQPLPKPFLNDADRQVGQLATNYNANEKITAGSTTAYIGTSEDGPQSVIFTKGSLLVLIKSSAQVSDKDWTTYISALNR